MSLNPLLGYPLPQMKGSVFNTGFIELTKEVNSAFPEHFICIKKSLNLQENTAYVIFTHWHGNVTQNDYKW